MAHLKQTGLAFVAVISTTVVGCQIVAGLTDLRPPKDTSAASTAATGTGGAGGQGAGGEGGQATATGQGGARGTSAATGAGGAGGQGGGTAPECTNDDDCNKNDTDCANGVCNTDGTCGVELVSKGTACGQGKQCDDLGNCVEGGCVDAQKGATETDVDCGGVCPKKCMNGKGCDAAADCSSGVCDTSSANANGSAGSCKACATDPECPSGQFCQLALGGKCVPKSANGGLCDAANGCASGFCVDNVCCNTACSGACQACSSAVDPVITSGTCGVVAAGMKSKGDACGIYFCNGNGGACPTACAKDGDCSKDAHCDKTKLLCELDKAYGEPCAFGNECIGAEYCVDATCCEQMDCPVGKSCNNAEGKCK
ncbi:MAG: hypothetical protein FJ096_04835 [Deltaproteobacteria bacterium]|nr:hypothetical protein [Deltaproteobacteria bacterium]